MRGYQVYDATKEKLFLPFVFLNRWQEEYNKFIANYDPRVGFLVTKRKKDYFIYLGGYQYKLGRYEQQYKPVGFSIMARDDISQRNTVTLATESIRIVGLGKDYFIMQSQWTDFAHSHYGNNFSQCLKRLDELLSGKKTVQAQPAHPLWQRLSEISEGKRAFASNFLIEWPYISFTQGNKVEDGYLCIFQMAAPDKAIAQNEKRFDGFRRENGLIDEDDETDQSMEALRELYVNTLSAGSIIEIPLNREPDPDSKQPMLYGTIRQLALPGVTHDHEGEPLELEETFYGQDEHFCQNWVMTVFFKDDSVISVKDIASSDGVIIERVSTDYQHYKSTLSAMTNPTSNQYWSVAEQVLIHNQLTPFPKGEPLTFYSKNLNDNQKQAIQLAVDAPDFCLIQGPPGSGKTTIITEMIRHFIARGQRVLVCSKGNLAVDNVLEKWIRENENRSDKHLCVRLGDHYKLDFLKDFTPANVTSRVQNKAYHKTQQEQNFLVAQVQQQIDFVDGHKATVEKMTDLCIRICRIADTLSCLCDKYSVAINHYKQWAGLLPQKAECAANAYRTAYNGLMLPCYQLLRSEETPSSEQAEQFDFQFRQLSEQIQAAMTAFRPGFFVRLFTGMGANYWTVLEQELQQQLSALSAMGIQGSMLQGNPLCSVDSLRLSGLGDTPAPRQLLEATEKLRRAMMEFSQRETTRLERIRTVLNDWLIELGSGISSKIEQNVVLDSVPVIGSTCMGIMSDSDFNSVTYDVVIVDEAGQIPIFDILVPIIKAKKVVLIGDHLQLPPMDENDFARYYAARKTGTTQGEDFDSCQQEVAQWYNVSLFEKLYLAPDLAGARTMLNTQYRMHPDISRFISENFYSNQYLAGVTAEMRTLQIAGFDKPIYFYDTCGMPAEERAETDHKPGYSNEVEAKQLSDVLVKLILAIREGAYTNEKLVMRDKETKEIIGYDIGVISGYKKQVKAIYTLTRQKLEQYMSAEEAQMHMDRFMISSVDSFQGRDNQVILFSMTRSNPNGRIGFLKDVRRLNVAITRAKSLLIMVGDSATLTACDAMCAHDKNTPVRTIYQNLVDYCKEKNYYIPLKGGSSYGTN